MKKKILINLKTSTSSYIMHDQNFYAKFILFVIILTINYNYIKMDNMNVFNIFKINEAIFYDVYNHIMKFFIKSERKKIFHLLSIFLHMYLIQICHRYV